MRPTTSPGLRHSPSEMVSLPPAAADPTSYDYGTMRYGKLSFVDLAGSERVKDSKSEGTMLKETININKSLSVLGKVRADPCDGSCGGWTECLARLARLPPSLHRRTHAERCMGLQQAGLCNGTHPHNQPWSADVMASCHSPSVRTAGM